MKSKSTITNNSIPLNSNCKAGDHTGMKTKYILLLSTLMRAENCHRHLSAADVIIKVKQRVCPPERFGRPISCFCQRLALLGSAVRPMG